MFKLYETDGTERALPFGVTPLDVTVSSIQQERDTESMEDVPGVINYGSRDATRELQLKLFYRIDSSGDFGDLRTALHKTFRGTFLVEEARLPDRWYKVTAPGSFTVSRYENNQTAGELTVSCEMESLPYAVSKNEVVINDTGSVFTVDVEGTEPIEPYHMFLGFDLSNIQGSTSHVELYNTTNDTHFYISEMLGSTDTVSVDGVTVKINQSQALRRTTRQFITLEPGINVLELRGATSTEFSLRYKNYYV